MTTMTNYLRALATLAVAALAAGSFSLAAEPANASTTFTWINEGVGKRLGGLHSAEALM